MLSNVDMPCSAHKLALRPTWMSIQSWPPTALVLQPGFIQSWPYQMAPARRMASSSSAGLRPLGSRNLRFDSMSVIARTCSTHTHTAACQDIRWDAKRRCSVRRIVACNVSCVVGGMKNVKSAQKVRQSCKKKLQAYSYVYTGMKTEYRFLCPYTSRQNSGRNIHKSQPQVTQATSPAPPPS